MFSQDNDGQQRLALTLVFGLVAFIVMGVLAFGVYQLRHSRVVSTAPGVAVVPAVLPSQPASAAPAEAPVSAAQIAQAASDAASVKVEQGVVKFYFASGKADLAAGAGEALVDLIKAARSGRKLVISGFHDATGNAAQNAALAKQRAVAVREALMAAGVAEQQIELKKPEQMADSGNSAEARRVEIRLQ
ncbi:OmpA family protein [Polaromonas jejuensis]|uniref:OmpA family protein n=1 Tax=Polaromonas jejuensis TaxID=457502 RepID=A0ABW0QAE3_9BURK|nr:OmpA family protein [Polaromonas jejuensis]